MNWFDILARFLVCIVCSFTIFRSSQLIRDNYNNDALSKLDQSDCLCSPVNDMSIQEFETVIPVCLLKIDLGSGKIAYAVRVSHFFFLICSFCLEKMSKQACSSFKNPQRRCTELVDRQAVTLVEDLPKVPFWSWMEPLTLVICCILLFVWVLSPIIVRIGRGSARKERALINLRNSLAHHQLQEI